jgi:hypothetical protein
VHQLFVHARSGHFTVSGGGSTITSTRGAIGRRISTSRSISASRIFASSSRWGCRCARSSADTRTICPTATRAWSVCRAGRVPAGDSYGWMLMTSPVGKSNTTRPPRSANVAGSWRRAPELARVNARLASAIALPANRGGALISATAAAFVACCASAWPSGKRVGPWIGARRSQYLECGRASKNSDAL